MMSGTPSEPVAPDDRCLHRLFEAQAARTPEAVAVGCAGRELSYDQLNRSSNRVAHWLRGLGVRAETPVAVCAGRSLEHVTALLGILKAGGTYVPLDPATPAERVAFVLEDTQAPLLLADRHLVPGLPRGGARVSSLEQEQECLAHQSEENPDTGAIGGQRAYVFYTSGSTGKPKGVEVEHRGVVNEAIWTHHAFAVSPADRATWLSSPAFAVSRWELWPYLTAGASIHIADVKTATSPVLLRDWLQQQSITVSFVVTALAERLWSLDWRADTSLRLVITGGEKLQRWPPASLPFEVVNSYGVTETSGARLTVNTARQQRNHLTPPIGRPIANTRVYVLDERLAPVPAEAPGELHVGGAGLARGYLGRPGLTAERFIPDQFTSDPGARMYRTGDLVRRLPDGNLEYLGRVDNQVKIGGVRVEPGEVETLLRQHPMVQEAVVAARVGMAGGKRLVAYIVAHPGRHVTAQELRGFLREHVTWQMVPSVFMTLGTLPLSPNGKVDRRRLPEPEPGDPSREHVAPRDATEQALAGLWAKLLGRERVGVDDDFLQLGGDSLLAMQLLAAVSDRFGREVSVTDFFEDPTVAGLAQRIARAGQEAGPTSAPRIESAPGNADQELLARSHELSDDEVTALLETLLAEERDQ